VRGGGVERGRGGGQRSGPSPAPGGASSGPTRARGSHGLLRQRMPHAEHVPLAESARALR